MSLLLRNLFRLHRLEDEATEHSSAGGGGGGEADLNVDIAAASDLIGDELGLGGDDKGGVEELDDGSATPPAKKEATPPLNETPEAKSAREAKERALAAAKPDPAKVAAAKQALTAKKVDFTGKTDAEVLKLAEAGVVQPKALPKAWKAENKAIWDKLAPEAQAYIEQREAQTEEGFKAQSEVANYGKALREVMQPYEALLTAQGVKDHQYAVKAVMNAHFVLSTAEPAKKAQFMAQLAKNYGVDLGEAVKFFTNGDPATANETPAERANRERLDRLETERNSERRAAFESVKAQSAAEVEAFASDPAHPYFNEVAGEVALLLRDPKLSLEEAYGRAIYANPVTRAKELARLQEEADAKARTEAEAKAKAAEKARGTRVRGQEEHRASPDLLGSMEDTMRDTLKNIQSRTT